MLVVLDVNGVVATKFKVGDNYTNPNRLQRIRSGSYYYFVRPGAKVFLETLYKNYEVAFYSSTLTRNLQPFLDELLTQEQMDKTLFIWSQEKCIKDPDVGKIVDGYTIPSWAIIKSVEKIYEEYPGLRTTVNEPTKLVVCDDTTYKLRFVDEREKIIVDTFNDLNETKNIFIDLLNDINCKFGYYNTLVETENKTLLSC